MKANNPLKRFVKSEKGAVMAMMAVFIPIFTLLVFVILDLGRLYVAQTELQTCVDASALAAANTGLTYNDGVNPPYAVIPTPDGPNAADSFFLTNWNEVNNQGAQLVTGYPQYNPEGVANYSNGKIHVVAQATIQTTVAQILGIDHMTYTRDSWASVTP